MVTTEEILITMLARDEASNVFEQVAGNAQSQLNGISGSTDSASSSFADIGASAVSNFDAIGSSISALNTGLMGLSSANRTMMGELGAKKSATELVFGTTSKEDTNKVLIKNMGDTEEQSQHMLDTIDKVTDGSLTSMQELIPALNAFQSATGASGQEIENVSSGVADFGAFVLAQTGSTQLASTAMMDLGKAIKGAYASLDQYGITEDALKDTGLWDGNEKDVQGFIQAVNEATGPVDELMNTAEGVDAQMGKMWSRAGKQIGREVLPQTKSLKSAFMELDTELGGNLSKSILLISFGIEEAQQKFTMLNTTFDAFKNMHQGFSTAIQMIRNMGQTATDSASAVNNLAEATSNVSGVANTVGQATTGAEEVVSMGGSGAEVVGGFSGLGADYYQELSQQTGKKVGVGRDTFDEVIGEVHDKMNNFNSYEEVLNAYDDEINELQDNIRYISESEDFTSEAINSLGSKSVDGRSGSNANAMNRERQKLENLINEREKIKETVAIAKAKGSTDDELEIIKDFVSTDFIDKYLDTAQVDVDDEEMKTLSQAIRGKFSNFRTSITGALDSVKSIPSAISGKISSVKSSIGGIADKFREIKADGLSGAISRLDTALYNPFRKTAPVAEAVAGAEEMAEGVGAVAQSSAVIGAESATMGATAPAVEAGAVGAEATAVAETSLSGAFMSMIVPTLAIAGVIAILIPIVAGLVLEALFFVNLIGQVITAMNFDNINVDGVAEKLQALALAMAWIGVAMASMSFAGLMTGIAFVMTGFGQVQTVLGQAVTMIQSAMTEVSKLGENTVDDSVVFNLQNLGNALNSISMAMMSLVGVNITSFIGNILTLGGTFGSLSGNLSKVKTDLQKAIDTINTMDFTGINEDKVGMIKTTMEALGAFGEAFNSLVQIKNNGVWSGITDIIGGLFGVPTQTIQQAFQNAHSDLVMASRQLGQYKDLETVDEETANKIKNVSDSIVAVADAIENLKKLKEDKGFMGAIDSFLNGGNDNLIAGLDTANTVIRQASSRLASLKTIAKIDESVTEKLKTLNDTLKAVMDVVTAMGQIKTADKDIKLDTIPQLIETAKKSIQQVAMKLASLKGLKEIDPSVSAKLTSITNTLGEVNEALTQIGTVNQTTGGWNFKGLETKYANIKNTLVSFSSQMSSLGKSLSDEANTVPSDLSSKLASIGSVAGSLGGTVTKLSSIPKVSRSITGQTIQFAVQTVQNASRHMGGLNKVQKIDEGVSSTVNAVGKAGTSLKNVVNGLTKFPKVSRSIIGLNVQHAVQTVQNVAKYIRGLSNKDKVGNNVEGILDNVSSALKSLKTTLKNMNFKPQGSSLGKSLRNGMSTGIGNLAPVFSGKIRAGVNGSGAFASGKVMGTYVTNGVKQSAKFSQIFKDEMGYIKQALDSHGDLVESAKAMAQAVVDGAKEGADSHSPGAIARMWGDEMNYSSMLMERNSTGLIRSARSVASNVVSTFNNRSSLTPKLMNFDTIKSDLNKTQFSTMMELRKPSKMGSPQRPVQIHIGEGAVQLDARNMTMKESRQIMINALEGLDMVTGVNVDKNI